MCVLELLGVVQQRRQYQHIPMTLPIMMKTEKISTIMTIPTTLTDGI